MSVCTRPEFPSQLLQQIFKNFQTAVLKNAHTKPKQTYNALGATQKSYAPLKASFSVQVNTQETNFFKIKVILIVQISLNLVFFRILCLNKSYKKSDQLFLGLKQNAWFLKSQAPLPSTSCKRQLFQLKHKRQHSSHAHYFHSFVFPALP